MGKVEEIFEGITDRIIGMLETGIAPWRKPWRTSDGAMPYNAYTGREYRGMLNTFILGFAGQAFGCNAWVGFHQCVKMGGSVKGQKSTWILAPLVKKERDENGQEQTRVFGFRGVYVFNVAQCEGITLPTIEQREHNANEDAEALWSSFPNPPALLHGGGRACYSPQSDAIHMPKPEDFDTASDYYGTLFHEATHATGAEKRLNRPGIAQFDRFGSHQYSQEELVAEMGSAYLLALAGMEPKEEQNAAYIGHWLAAIKGDRDLVRKAAIDANRGTRLIAARFMEARVAEDEAEAVAAA